MVSNTTLKPAPATLEITHLKPPPCHDLRSGGNSRIVLYSASEAKEKLVNAKVTEEVIAAIMTLARKNPALMSALVDWVCSNDLAKIIAQRYSLDQSLLSYWRRRLDLPMRRRGRRAMLHPTMEHRRVLQLVREHGIAETARRVDVSKQRVSQIVSRWEPELGGRRTKVKVLTLPKRKRRPRRNIVVSFRITSEEWQRVLAVAPVPGEPKLSGFKKARAILLRAIEPPGGNGGEIAQELGAAGAEGEGKNIVDLYTRRAA